MSRLLDSIDTPSDLKSLSLPELERLSDEVRQFILDSVSKTGGHLGTNLGVVELTVALLHVFDPPTDKIVWDTTHQTYAYKILTGRKDRFDTLRKIDGLSGFQKRDESPYDAFGAGHAGTALSAALGMAVARDQRNGDDHVVGVVGDAAVSCGISFEALNNVSTTAERMIIILNDNEMSIAENVGAISKSLGKLLSNEQYNKLKRSLEGAAKKALRADWYRDVYHKAEEALKGFFLESPMFEELGLRYVGPIDGHNIPFLVSALEMAKDYDHPIVLHVATTKGKGYEPAEAAPETWHSTGVFNTETGEAAPSKKGPMKYQDVFGKVAMDLAEKRQNVVAITAGMPSGTGLAPFAKAFPKRFFDVGISEEHAVIFAAGLATDGIIPLTAIYSTFTQRAVDCIIHDVCIQKLPVVFCLDRAGVVGDDGPTHHGVFDIALLRPVPELTIMQPKDEAELSDMLYLAVDLGKPVVVRYPRGGGVGAALPEAPRPIEVGRAELIEPGRDVQVWALGDMQGLGAALVEILRSKGYEAGLVNPRFVKPLDAALLTEQAASAKLFVSIENGVITGGFGSGLQEVLQDAGATAPVLRLGWPDAFVEHGTPDQLMERHGLTADVISAKVLDRLQAMSGPDEDRAHEEAAAGSAPRLA